MTAEERRYAMLLHLSLLAGYLVPLAGFVLPIVIWQIKKDELPALDEHGRNAVNWLITSVIAWAAVILMFVTLVLIPVAILLSIVLGVVTVAFPIVAAIKADGGQAWRYPGSFQIA